MNINQAYPSKYISEPDLQGQPRVLTIARVGVETLDQSTGETKPILYFQGAKKGMVLNVTNKNVIVLLYGTETDNWIGREIELYPSQTDFRGEVVPCIRCRAPHAAGALGVAPVQPAAVPAVAGPSSGLPTPATNSRHTPTVTSPFEPSNEPEKPFAEAIGDEIPF